MKRRLFLATFVMVAAFAVAVVACKKDNENALLGNNNETSKGFDMRQIDDMNAYLKNFRQKMLEGKDCETLSLEDAAWHLASLMNYEHCNINVHFDDVRFDTLDMQVNVTDGSVLMEDLRTAYEQTWPIIKKFQDGLGLDNQNLRFVNMFISEDGNAKIALMTTSFSNEKTFYFPSDDYLDSICDYYFTNTGYRWNILAITELTRICNIFEGNRFTDPQSSCYIPTRFNLFYYNVWIDPDDPMSFYSSSRLFAKYDPNTNNPNTYSYYLNSTEMCYCLDSYLGMGMEYLNDNPYVDDEYPISWEVSAESTLLNTIGSPSYYVHNHSLKVQYGQLCIVDPGLGHN